jgi:hypothetical protein
MTEERNCGREGEEQVEGPQPRAAGATMKFSLQQARLAQVSETAKPALNIPAILTIP